ncbi:MAG: hypothetical protein Q8N99_04920 [Nanoarchaeota archaeon]|nr:hypothetical protein [Nanoarchaeota archaeon]
MKKENISILLILFLVLPNILAIEVKLSKDNYIPRETLQSEITGTFIYLRLDNIQIYEGEKVHPEPVIANLAKYQNKYYYYAMLPNREGNFTLRIIGGEYIESGELRRTTIIKNFTITRSNVSALSINPGLVYTTKDFSLKLKSIYGNQLIIMQFEGTGETKNLTLIEESEDSVSFSIKRSKPGLNNLKINNYNIPIFVIKTDNPLDEIINLNFDPYELSGSIITGKDYSFKIVIDNSGTKNLTNISFSNNIGAIISPKTIDSLNPGEIEYINVTIPVSSKEKEKLSGEIIIHTDYKNFTIPVDFKIIEKVEEINISVPGVTTSINCYDSGGKVCREDQECDGELTPSMEGPCCKGECNDKKKTNYTFAIGLILLLVILLAVAFIMWKAKQKRKSHSADEVINERIKKFEDRMGTPIEVEGKLDKV